LAALFVAWASEDEQQRWLDEGRRLVGTDFTELATATLESARTRGYESVTGTEVSANFRKTVLDNVESRNGDASAAIRRAMRAIVDSRSAMPASPSDELADATMIMVPVRDHDGRVVLNLGIVNLTGQEDRVRLQQYLYRLVMAAQNATRLVEALPRR
jgi:DNA-binding IclR family transcriptional regulator